MDEDESALGRVPIPFHSLAYGADLRVLLRAPLETSFVGQRKPWHIILIQDLATLEEVGRIVPDLRHFEAGCAMVICGDRAAQAQLGPLIADCYDATSSLLFTAHAREFRPHSARLFPDAATGARIRELLAIPAHVIPFSVTTFAGRLCDETVTTAQERLLHVESWE